MSSLRSVSVTSANCGTADGEGCTEAAGLGEVAVIPEGENVAAGDGEAATSGLAFGDEAGAVIGRGWTCRKE